MAATIAMAGEYFGSAAAAEGGAAVVGEGAATAAVGEGVTTAAVAGGGAAAGTDLGLLGAESAAGTGAVSSAVAGGGAGAAVGADLAPLGATSGAGANSMMGKLGSQALGAVGTSVATSLLSPKPTAPGVAPVVGMPDPLAQEQARKQAMIEQMARRGRASTIMTDDASGSGKLGG